MMEKKKHIVKVGQVWEWRRNIRYIITSITDDCCYGTYHPLLSDSQLSLTINAKHHKESESYSAWTRWTKPIKKCNECKQ